MSTDADSLAQRFKLTLAYDGRPFKGWGSQPCGNTIQDHLLKALQSIAPEIATVQGSGRTDAGVCAEGQVAHFDAPAGWKMDEDAWRKALNTKLPRTIRIFGVEKVDSEFHARFSAKEKHYRYQIHIGEVLPPTQLGLMWHQPGIKSVKAIAEAVSCFEGAHDFRSFSANRNDGKDEGRDTVRTIFQASVTETPENVVQVDFTGNGFLYKMVRFLVGTATIYERNKVSLAEIENWLQGNAPNEKAPFCSPPDGLSLVNVRYRP